MPDYPPGNATFTLTTENFRKLDSISDCEVLQDIETNEREIRSLKVRIKFIEHDIAEREEFVAKLRRLLKLRREAA